jgi:2-phospho-L-lactate guanylyltransferase
MLVKPHTEARMRALCIIPVKDLDCTKTRLIPVLSPRRRQALTLSILSRTIEVLKSSGRISEILVVTPDFRVISFVKELGVLGLRQKGNGLNEALGQATRWAIGCRFDSVLILPSDIPLLDETDIGSIVCAGLGKENIVVISPNKKKTGTNALFVKPPGILKYCFGPGSFNYHVKQALGNSLELKICYSTSIGFDLDSPEEYEFLLSEGYIGGTLEYYEGKNRFFDPSSWNAFHPTGG